MFERAIPTWLAAQVGFRLVGRSGGFAREVARVYRQRRASEFQPEAAMRAQQLSKLSALLQHAQQHCPYYTDVFKQVGFDAFRLRSLDDLKRIPVLSKTDLLAHRDRLVSRAHPVSELQLNSTGGSTGVTVNFYQDRRWLVHQVAGGQFFDSMAGWRPGCRTTYLWGAPGDNAHASANWRAEFKNWLTNVRLCDSFNMSDADMARYHVQLSRFRPHVLVCYAGSVHLFAKYLLAQGLRPGYPLESIITSAETLTDDMRGTIKAAFGVPVFNRYGSREVGVIGAECERHQGLHVNELDMVVETDAQTEAGAQAQGDVLVTNLNNFGMPLIRYRIGDVGQLDSSPCSCGRPGGRITRLFGRSSDFFTTAGGRKVHGEYFTHLFYGLDGVARFQLVQESLHEFQLTIVKNPSHWRPELESWLRRELIQVFGESIDLRIGYANHIAASASGKYRFTISKV